MKNLITDVMNQVPDTSPSSEDLGAGVVGDEGTVHANDSTDDGEDVSEYSDDNADGTPVDSEESAPLEKQVAPATKASDKKTSLKDTITVSDGEGRKKLEIDYGDRDSIKKAFEMAHGARKWQADRDKAIAAQQEIRTKYESDRRVLDALEKAYEEHGELGVIDLISGKPGASKEFIQKQLDRARYLESASPEEVQQLQQKERLEQLERELSKQRGSQEAYQKKIEGERETAELRSLESRVNPAFEKYRFDGKLGDADDEALFDEMLWNATMKRLAPYEEKGVEMTRELVDNQFKAVAAQLRKRVNVQADKKAAANMAQKKQEATENAQASTMSAYRKGGTHAEATDLIRKGDFKSLIGNWGKYSSGFRKK